MHDARPRSCPLDERARRHDGQGCAVASPPPPTFHRSFRLRLRLRSADADGAAARAQVEFGVAEFALRRVRAARRGGGVEVLTQRRVAEDGADDALQVQRLGVVAAQEVQHLECVGARERGPAASLRNTAKRAERAAVRIEGDAATLRRRGGVAVAVAVAVAAAPQGARDGAEPARERRRSRSEIYGPSAVLLRRASPVRFFRGALRT